MLLAALALLFATSPILWLLRPHRLAFAGWLAALPPALIAGWLLTQIGPVSQGATLAEAYPWAPWLQLELSLRLDGLSLFFGLIITVIGAAIALYTHYYLDQEERLGQFYAYLFLFMASMLGLVWSDNLIVLTIFWEGTSISSYLLIGFNNQKPEARKGAATALGVTGLGGLCLVAGVVFLGMEAGTFSISALLSQQGLTEGPRFPLILALLLLGAFTKSAQFPFHFWLPSAMAAPTPASAYLHSATMVKAGIYLLARLHPALSDSPLWFWSLLLVGGLTMLIGAVTALGKWDLKALLAYATVSQLGILVMLLALPSQEALVAAAVGILAHAFYKGPLFMVAGAVDHATHSRDLRHLAALARQMPWVAGAALLAGLSMAGLPPLFGFLAKEGLLESFFHQLEHDQQPAWWVAIGAVVVAGACFVAYSLTLLWETFFRPKSLAVSQATVTHRPTFGLVFPIVGLTLVGTVLPFTLAFPTVPLVSGAVGAMAGAPTKVYLSLWHGVTPALLASLVAIAAGLLLFALREPVRTLLHRSPPWLDGNRFYDGAMERLVWLSKWTLGLIQGRTLATHASVLLLAGLAATVSALRKFNWDRDLHIDWGNWPEAQEVLLVIVAIIAALITVRATTRLNAIVSLGVVGITVTLVFVFFSAPDLALTQLLIEVLTLVLLILVFYRIAPQQHSRLNRFTLVRNVLVSAGSGFVGAALVLVTAGIPYAPSISEFFLRHAIPDGHGANVVNVILVDFRSFDTLGEISVLAIAGLGGYALLRSFRLRPQRAEMEVQAAAASQPPADGAGSSTSHQVPVPPGPPVQTPSATQVPDGGSE